MSVATESLLGQTVGETTQITPTVKVLPAKVEKKELPPQYKTNKLPPKDEHKKLNPIFPPGVQPFALPNF